MILSVALLDSLVNSTTCRFRLIQVNTYRARGLQGLAGRVPSRGIISVVVFSSFHKTAPAHRIPGPRYQGPSHHESAAKESLSRAARCAAVWARTGTDPSRPVGDGSVWANGCQSRCSVP